MDRPGLACNDHQLALGSDVDNVTLRRLAANCKIADLVWEASEDLAAEHGHAFQAAMQAYHAGHSEQHWQELQAIWSRAWAANYAALELLQNVGITTFLPVNHSAGSSPLSSTTAGLMALRTRTSTTPSSPV